MEATESMEPMSHRKRFALVATALACVLPATGAADAVVLERAPLVRGERRHGEVRVVERDGCIAVETALVSRVLRRVVREIAVKERAATPDGSPRAADRRRYLAALERARVAAERGPADADRRRSFTIELARCGDERRASVDGTALELSPGWIDERIRAIAADAIGLDDDRLDSLFGVTTRAGRR